MKTTTEFPLFESNDVSHMEKLLCLRNVNDNILATDNHSVHSCLQKSDRKLSNKKFALVKAKACA